MRKTQLIYQTMAATGSDPSGDLNLEVLQALDKSDPILSAEAFPQIPFAEMKATLDRLGSRSMVTYESIEREKVILEPEGQEIVAKGSHEARVFEAVRQALEGLSIADLEKAIGDKSVVKVGQGKAFKEKWISKTKDNKLVASVCVFSQKGRELQIADLHSRKSLLPMSPENSFRLSKTRVRCPMRRSSQI